jgi:hypothetical protein
MSGGFEEKERHHKQQLIEENNKGEENSNMQAMEIDSLQTDYITSVADGKKDVANNNNNKNHNNNNSNDKERDEDVDDKISLDCSSDNDLNETQADEQEENNDFDSDSALSSINASEFAKSAADAETNSSLANLESEIVWGCFSKFKWYPCLVIPFTAESPPRKNQVLVKYFSWNGLYSYIFLKNILPFTDVDAFNQELIAKKKLKSDKTYPFTRPMLRAIAEAKCFQLVPKHLRLATMDQLIVFQRKYKDLLVLGENVIADADVADSIRYFLSEVCMSMHRYDQNNRIELKNERINKKMVNMAVDSAKTVVFAAARGTATQERRRSTRNEERRPSYESNQHVPTTSGSNKRKLSEITVSSSSVKEEKNVQQPKPKKLKAHIEEESLEEKFLAVEKDPCALFKDVPKDKICCKCFEHKANVPTEKCAGKHCFNWLHESCCNHIEQKPEQIRHKTGDSDDLIETEVLKNFLTCDECYENGDFEMCLVCSEKIIDTDAITCNQAICKRSFHKKCMEKWPKIGIECPLHCCHTCYSKWEGKNIPLVRCVKCAATYHGDFCTPAGSKILSRSQIICPRHESKKEKWHKRRGFKPLNIDLCNVCLKSGSLVCCDGCPTAFHAECINFDTNDEKFLCDDCLQRSLPLYNTIVWAKVGVYR